MNRIPRVYLPVSAFVDSHVTPTREAAHHLFRVLRLRTGDQWAALDGESRSWLCEVVDESRSQRIQEWPSVERLAVQVDVGLALCKGQRFEDALEKLAELGVERVIPLRTDRTERGFPSSAKLLRWDQIAKSSSALANRRVPLELAPPRDLQDLLEEIEPQQTVYCHHNGATPHDLFRSPKRHFTLLIGPEGGFSPAELEKLQGRGKRVSLGPLTLRVETAAVVAASLALTLPLKPS